MRDNPEGGELYPAKGVRRLTHFAGANSLRSSVNESLGIERLCNFENCCWSMFQLSIK